VSVAALGDGRLGVPCAIEPVTLHLLESTQQELPEATRLLDLSDHRFEGR
jgi:hypothetical protein